MTNRCSLFRSFTLMEIVIVLFILGAMLSLVSHSLSRMLSQHYFKAEFSQFKDILEELQLESLALGSDMEVYLYRKNNKWKGVTKTQERILKPQKFSLSHVENIIVDSVPVNEMKIILSSDGHISPKGVIQLSNKQQRHWIDLRYPLLIRCLSKDPGDFVLCPITFNSKIKELKRYPQSIEEQVKE